MGDDVVNHERRAFLGAVENSGTMSVQFTTAEAAELNAAVSAIEVQGARLPDGVLRMSGVEAPPKG